MSHDYLCQAYIGNTDKCYAPYKTAAGHELNERQKAYNKILSWYRVTIEHLIGYVKRFVLLL